MRLFYVILLVALPFAGISQQSAFYTQVTDNGALLVRLANKQTQVAALREKGKTTEADQLAASQAKRNKSIMKAFAESYSVGPVYFFYPSHTQAVKDKNWEQVVFLNQELMPDAGIRFTGDKFLTAEIAVIDQNEIRAKSKYDKKHNTQYHNGSSSTFEALVLKNDQLEKLPDPYLIFVRTFQSVDGGRPMEKVVSRFNKRLSKRLPASKKG